MSERKPIYLDYSATTPVDPRVAQKMIPYLTEDFGNPASRSHPYGWTAEQAVENAREEVAKLVNADPREIVWTSGATESNNLALHQLLSPGQLQVAAAGAADFRSAAEAAVVLYDAPPDRPFGEDPPPVAAEPVADCWRPTACSPCWNAMAEMGSLRS